MDQQLFLGQGLTQFLLEVAPFRHVLLHLRDIMNDPAARVRFRLVKRNVAAFEQRAGTTGVGWRERDADAGPDGRAMAVEREGPPHFGEDGSGGRGGPRRAGRGADEHAIFIAANARDEIGRRRAASEPFADLSEKLIADHMAECVVDLLEAGWSTG
jgi:hypothetical protein